MGGSARTKRESRLKYWRLHEQPVKKIAKRPGYARRLWASDHSLLWTIAELGSRSDVAVLRMAANDLQHNRAFNEHQQKLRGAIARLRKSGMVPVIPNKSELIRAKSAFVTLEGR